MREPSDSVAGSESIPTLPMMGVLFGSDRPEVAIGGLFFNPLEEQLKQRGLPQRVEAGIYPRQVRVPESRVDLHVAGLAQGRAMMSLATLLFGSEVVQRDQPRRDTPATQLAPDPVVVIA